MRAEGKVWVFFDANTGKETKPMAIVQAQMALLQFRLKDLSHIYIWTPGWSDWQNLKTFLDSDQKYFAFAQPPRPPNGTPKKPSTLAQTITATTPPNQSTKKKSSDADFTQIVLDHNSTQNIDYGYYHNDFNGDQLELTDVKKVQPLKQETITKTIEDSNDDRRRATRHNFKLEVVLINKEGSFRTFSKNISNTGTLLEDVIPKSFLNKPFELIIINRFEADPQKARLLFKANIVGDLTNPRRLMFTNIEDSMKAKLNAMLEAYIFYQKTIHQKSS